MLRLLMFLLACSFARPTHATAILENIKRVLPVGDYRGSNPQGECEVKVEDDGELLKVTVSAVGEQGLAFTFAAQNANNVIAESFGTNSIYLEYSQDPEDPSASPVVRGLNVDQQFVSVHETRRSFFSSQKAKDCTLSESPTR